MLIERTLRALLCPRFLCARAKHARNVVSYFRERGAKNGMSTLLQLKTYA
jgi:hypothetical protein